MKVIKIVPTLSHSAYMRFYCLFWEVHETFRIKLRKASNKDKKYSFSRSCTFSWLTIIIRFYELLKQII